MKLVTKVLSALVLGSVANLTLAQDATNLDQLRTIVSGVDIELNKEILDDISEVHKAHPMPY